MTFEQQKDILDHTFELLTKFNNGVSPKGSVAPWWETSKEGTALLLDKGIEYGVETYLHYYLRFLTYSYNQLCRPFKHGARVSVFFPFPSHST